MTPAELTPLLDRLIAGWENRFSRSRPPAISPWHSYAQKHAHAKNLLAAVCADGLMFNDGTRPQPRWVLDNGGKK